MCTVTYIPSSKDNGFILTSNRDEKHFRPTTPPEIYNQNGINVGFPKDAKGGGSWIAANEKGRLCCLLNGAFVAHKKQSFHTHSRGSVLLQLASSPSNVEDFFNEMVLTPVEPFTIVTIDHVKGQILGFNEFIWDGTETHFRELDVNTPYIWSSVTLYNKEHQRSRKEWFLKFCKEQKDQISPDKAFSFHSGSHTSDQSVNVVMKREGGLKTVSITQVIAGKNKHLMKYTDLLNHTNHQLEI